MGGSVKLLVKWCHDNDPECVNESAVGYSVKGTEKVECEQSCHLYLGKALKRETAAIASKIHEAQRAQSTADHYDDIEDHYEDLQDEAEDRRNHELEERY